MEFSTILILFLAAHGLVAFVVSISILSCPFRFDNEKLGLFLLTWLIPLIGAIFSHHRIGKLGSIKGDNSNSGTTSTDIPSTNRGCDGGTGGGGCD